MNSAVKVLEFIRALITHPGVAGAAIHDNTWWKQRFIRRFGHENPLPLVDFSDFAGNHAVLEKAVFLGGGSMLTDLLLLQSLASRQEVNSYFEIGTWRGESMQAVLSHVRNAYSLDIEEKDVRGPGNVQQRQRQHRVLLKEEENVVYYRCDSRKFNFADLGIKADLIFIDGNHTYDYVRKDTGNVLQYLAHPGSVIVWHDYGMDPEHIRWEVYAGILAAVPKDKWQYLYHVSNTKCAILTSERINATEAVFPVNINSIWEVTVKKRTDS